MQRVNASGCAPLGEEARPELIFALGFGAPFQIGRNQLHFATW
jgi:hypothetical protein